MYDPFFSSFKKEPQPKKPKPKSTEEVFRCKVCTTLLLITKGKECTAYCSDCRHTYWFSDKGDLLKGTKGDFEKNRCHCNGCN